jgi:hypothetical protein
MFAMTERDVCGHHGDPDTIYFKGMKMQVVELSNSAEIRVRNLG